MLDWLKEDYDHIDEVELWGDLRKPVQTFSDVAALVRQLSEEAAREAAAATGKKPKPKARTKTVGEEELAMDKWVNDRS